jgi:hypothetical protein
MFTTQELQVYVTAIGVIIALAYYYVFIRSQISTRKAQLFMQIYSRFNENKFWETNFEMRRRLDLWEAEAVLESGYLTLDTQSLSQFNAFAAFFEGIGVLVKRGLIDLKLVNDLMASTISDSWESMKPIIERIRKQRDDVSYYKGFEYIYNQVKKTSDKQLSSWDS